MFKYVLEEKSHDMLGLLCTQDITEGVQSTKSLERFNTSILSGSALIECLVIAFFNRCLTCGISSFVSSDEGTEQTVALDDLLDVLCKKFFTDSSCEI